MHKLMVSILAATALTTFSTAAFALQERTVMDGDGGGYSPEYVPTKTKTPEYVPTPVPTTTTPTGKLGGDVVVTPKKPIVATPIDPEVARRAEEKRAAAEKAYADQVKTAKDATDARRAKTDAASKARAEAAAKAKAERIAKAAKPGTTESVVPRKYSSQIEANRARNELQHKAALERAAQNRTAYEKEKAKYNNRD